MMEVKVAQRSVFDRLGRSMPQQPYYNNRVCKYWLQGGCNRKPCRFLHPDFLENEGSLEGRGHRHSSSKFQSTWRNPNQYTSKNVKVSSSAGSDAGSHVGQKIVKGDKCEDLGSIVKVDKCEYLDSIVKGDKCEDLDSIVKGDKCEDLHSCFCGYGFSQLAKLEKHTKAVTGIALPAGSDKLFSGSKDESVCVWDCNTGQCVSSVKLDGEIGCLITEHSWVFVGLRNAVKAWNIQNNTEVVLTGPNGLVNALVTSEDMLFAGVQNGSILAWKSNSESKSPTATLNGHRLSVLSLIVGANRLYSGSKDGTIRVWDLKSFQCMQTLKGHTNFVTSLLCWDAFLFSGSLDATLKVWGATEDGTLKVMHEIKEESGILALSGLHDAEAKPILLVSCKVNNVVRLYELPDFAERGRICSKKEVRSLHTSEMSGGGLFFIGDDAGELSVWKLMGGPKKEA